MLKTVEQSSGHPLARAAVEFAGSADTGTITLCSVDEIAGKGMKASFKTPEDSSSSEFEALVGNESLMQDYGVFLHEGETRTLLEDWKGASYSVVLMAIRQTKPIREDWTLAAIFAAADAIRPESAAVVALVTG